MPTWRWNVGVKEKNLEENKVFKKTERQKGFHPRRADRRPGHPGDFGGAAGSRTDGVYW